MGIRSFLRGRARWEDWVFGAALIVIVWGVLITGLASGCSVTSWDAEADSGTHRTTWNHGLEVKVDGWGFYIGPGRGSTSTIDNTFSARARGPATQPAGGDDG